MKRILTSAVAAAMVMAGTGGEVQAQEMDREMMNRRVPRFEFGLYAGGAYTSDWYDSRNTTLTEFGGANRDEALFEDDEEEGFGFGFAPIFGTTATVNVTPLFGVRLHGAYMPSALPHGEEDFEDDYPQNNYFYDLDLVLSTPNLPLASSVLGNAYVFVGGGGLTTDIANGEFVDEVSDEETVFCEPGTLARGACLPLEPDAATVGQGVVGIGGDLYSFTSNIGAFVELAAHIYDSPVHVGEGFVTGGRGTELRLGQSTGIADDKYAVTTRLVAGVKFLFGNILPPPPPVVVQVTPPPPPPPPPAPVERAIRVCVVEGAVVREVEATFNPATGDTTVAGRPFAEAFPAMAPNYAASEAFFVNNEEIRVMDRTYVKFGLPRVVSPTDVARVGEFQGVGVFAEAGATTPPVVLYLPVRPGCEFQPYQQQEEVQKVRG